MDERVEVGLEALTQGVNLPGDLWRTARDPEDPSLQREHFRVIETRQRRMVADPELRIDRPTQVFNFPALLVSMILFLYVVLTGNRITRKEGWFLLAAYAVYLAGVVGMTLLQRS